VATKTRTNTVYYTVTDTPFGPMLIAGHGRTLVALKFNVDGRRLDGPLAQVERELGAKYELVRDDDAVAPIASQVRDYLAGKRTRFELKTDLSYVTPFRRSVLEACAAIPRGKTSTYAELARQVGRPAAFRAVGQTMATNPIPIVIPCHRVLGRGGKLHGFGGGLDMKAKLLALEGVSVA
jgi:O-6-methylguanine DNA methyltransferase